jgi:hypothetical protein
MPFISNRSGSGLCQSELILTIFAAKIRDVGIYTLKSTYAKDAFALVGTYGHTFSTVSR